MRKENEHTVTIKGIDEADSLKGEVSWVSPIARALLKAHEGDAVSLQTPGGAAAHRGSGSALPEAWRGRLMRPSRSRTEEGSA